MNDEVESAQKVDLVENDVSFICDTESSLESMGEELRNIVKEYDFVRDENDNQPEALSNAIEYSTKTFKLRQLKDEHEWRAIYLGRSFYLVGFVIYNAFLFLLFSAVGLFNISDSVMIALLTTAAANVIGILAVAFKWLYNNKI